MSEELHERKGAHTFHNGISLKEKSKLNMILLSGKLATMWLGLPQIISSISTEFK